MGEPLAREGTTPAVLQQDPRFLMSFLHLSLRPHPPPGKVQGFPRQSASSGQSHQAHRQLL